MKNGYRIDGFLNEQLEVMNGNQSETVNVLKAETFIAVPAIYGDTLVVSDRLYEDAFKAQQDQEYGYAAYHTFYVQDWKNTGDASRAIMDRLSENEDYSYYLKSLYLDWKSAQQQNGILLMVSGLVGIVFFTFAASFVYFRLYSDLARDEQQYRMIAKVGLSKNELGTIITKQLVIMFFLPMLIALIHSGVAFVALQQLVDFSIIGHSLRIFIFFLSMQIIYFFITRWRYLDRLNKIIQ